MRVIILLSMSQKVQLYYFNYNYCNFLPYHTFSPLSPLSHINSGRLQHYTLTNGQVIQAKINQKNNRVKRCYESNTSNTFTEHFA